MEDVIDKILDRSKSVAVVGLSDKPDRPSHIVANFLRERGYRIIPRITSYNVCYTKLLRTTFASFLLAGYNLSLAGALHGFVMFGTAIIVAWVWYREAPFYIRGSALISGILLFTPYAYYYDLSLLALPLAWLGWKNFTVGWKLTGNSLLIIIWLLPIIAPAIAIALGIQISPILIAFLLFFTLRQSRKNKSLIPS